MKKMKPRRPEIVPSLRRLLNSVSAIHCKHGTSYKLPYLDSAFRYQRMLTKKGILKVGFQKTVSEFVCSFNWAKRLPERNCNGNREGSSSGY